MLFFSSTPVLIRHLWQLKTVVFLHWSLICAVPLSGVYIGEGGVITPLTRTCDSDTLVVALATLGEATEIETILIAKVNKEGNIASRHRRHFCIQTSPM